MTPLRVRMIEDMQIRNLAALTQTAYIEHVVRLAIVALAVGSYM